MPEVDVLIPGATLRTNMGSAAFCSITLIRGEKLILVDSGHAGQRSNLVNALALRGLSPEDIDVCVLSHAHWDHSQNLDLFPRAEVLIHDHELRYARKPHRNDWATPRWTAAMLEFERKAVPVEEGYEIEPGVRLLHVPGHSAGTMAVLVDTPKGPAAVTGDAIQTATAAQTGINPLVFWNEGLARKSIARLRELAETIYPGHDTAFRLLKDGRPEYAPAERTGAGDNAFAGTIQYLTEKHVTIGGIAPDDPALGFDTTPRTQTVMPGIEEQALP